jgi:hypothetical protein
MRTALEYLVLASLPSVVMAVFWRLLIPRERPLRPPKPGSTTGVSLQGILPLERLSSDLHRLAVEIDKIEHSNPPAKVARLRAASLAYDDVLIAACRALEVPTAERSPLDPLSRLEAEAELSLAGFHW